VALDLVRPPSRHSIHAHMGGSTGCRHNGNGSRHDVFSGGIRLERAGRAPSRGRDARTPTQSRPIHVCRCVVGCRTSASYQEAPCSGAPSLAFWITWVGVDCFPGTSRGRNRIYRGPSGHDVVDLWSAERIGSLARNLLSKRPQANWGKGSRCHLTMRCSGRRASSRRLQDARADSRLPAWQAARRLRAAADRGR